MTKVSNDKGFIENYIVKKFEKSILTPTFVLKLN